MSTVNQEGPGRPAKFTPEATARIIEAIAGGNTYRAAAAFGGVEYRTFHRWMEEGDASEDENDPKKHFYHAVKQAEARAEVRIVVQWQQAIPGDWRAARDFLARRFPEDWGPKESVTHKGDRENPVQVEQEVTHVGTARERVSRRISELAARAGAKPPPERVD